jgi:hypothetical protein
MSKVMKQRQTYKHTMTGIGVTVVCRWCLGDMIAGGHVRDGNRTMCEKCGDSAEIGKEMRFVCGCGRVTYLSGPVHSRCYLSCPECGDRIVPRD